MMMDEDSCLWLFSYRYRSCFYMQMAVSIAREGIDLDGLIFLDPLETFGRFLVHGVFRSWRSSLSRTAP